MCVSIQSLAVKTSSQKYQVTPREVKVPAAHGLLRFYLHHKPHAARHTTRIRGDAT